MAKIKYRNKLHNLSDKMRISGKTLGKVTSHEGATETERIIGEYKAYKWAKVLMLLVVLVICVIVFAIDIGLGSYKIGFIEVYEQIFGRFADWNQTMSLDMHVVWELRMPRVILGLLVGVGLAMAGAAMQSMMKNPLADPYTTGISSGAALGATLALTMGVTLVSGSFGVVLNAFIFALLPAAFIILISIFRKPSPAMIILAGISLMYIFNAVQSYLMLVADPDAAADVYTWTVGSLTNSSWSDLPYVFAICVIGGLILMYEARILNTMNSGDAYSKSIGINVNRARIIILVTISFMAAGIVSFTGIIGFVGLVGPHIARMFVGSDNKILIPAAALMGAVIMLLSDSLVQIIGSGMPVGIITSILGGPVFLFLIIRQKKEIW